VHDLFIFTDEIYECFVYDNLAHVSLASLLDMAARTITISGYSKTFSITGWQIGHAVATHRWAFMIGAMNVWCMCSSSVAMRRGCGH
jgi:aminotransferase